MQGELRLSDDVIGDFAELVANQQRAAIASGVVSTQRPFRLGCSGGTSGRRCFERLSDTEGVEWPLLACYFADERCVAPDSPDANQRVIAEALGARRNELAGYYPMEDADGYDALLRRDGGFDLLQLGFGPDGHTASLFPRSSGLDAPANRLVIENTDPLGHNPHPRLTVTFGAISATPFVVLVVTGADKAASLRAVFEGDDLPAGRVEAAKLLWLCDREAASELPSSVRS